MQWQQSMGTRFESAPRSLLYLLLSAAIIKMSVLLINGPSFDHDSATYIAYADAILDHGRAFGPLVWGATPVPPFIFRFPGHPLILAGAKLMSPAHYAFSSLCRSSRGGALELSGATRPVPSTTQPDRLQ